MNPDLPPTIDPQAALRWQGIHYPGSPWLHEEVARRMQERLQWIRLQPRAWLHWEPLRGGLQAHALIAQRYPKSSCYVLEASATRSGLATKEIAKPWWNAKRWTGPNTHYGPAPDASVDMVWANMALHMAPRPQELISSWQRALAVDGFVMFSCLGPDTLRELRTLYQDLGWPAPTHEFTDMHDWGDMLVAGGFAEPVMDMERITLSFATPERLIEELRPLGRNLHPARFAGLRTPRWRARLLRALQEGVPRTADGQLLLTFEVIYGHAFKAPARLPVQPQTAVSLQDMRQALKQARPGRT